MPRIPTTSNEIPVGSDGVRLLWEGLKPFHAVSRLLKSKTLLSDGLWLCDWLED